MKVKKIFLSIETCQVCKMFNVIFLDSIAALFGSLDIK